MDEEKGTPVESIEIQILRVKGQIFDWEQEFRTRQLEMKSLDQQIRQGFTQLQKLLAIKRKEEELLKTTSQVPEKGEANDESKI